MFGQTLLSLGAAFHEVAYKIPPRTKYFSFRLRQNLAATGPGANLYFAITPGQVNPADFTLGTYKTYLTSEDQEMPFPLVGQTVYFQSDTAGQYLEIQSIIDQ